MNKILNSVKKSINVLSVAEKYPGQGVYSATVDHKYIIKKYSDYILSENRFRGFCDINHAHTVDIKSYCTLRKNRKKSYQVVSAHVVPNSLKGSLKFTSIWLPFFRLYLRSFYNTADNILAVSNETKNEIIRDLNIDAEKVIVFTNFVRKDMFYRTPEEKEKLRNVYRKKLGFSDSDFIVIGSGQVQPRKGIKDFYDLAVTFPEVKFIWTGGTPFKGATEGYHEMKKLVESAPENLIFTGNIDRDEMINYYALSDLFFLPSFHETFGLVIVEAAGCGLPVILRDLKVYDAIFKNYYCKGSNFDEFGEIINSFRNNPEKINEYKNLSYKLFSEYSDEKSFYKLKDIYEKGINKKFGGGIEN